MITTVCAWCGIPPILMDPRGFHLQGPVPEEGLSHGLCLAARSRVMAELNRLPGAALDRMVRKAVEEN